jgi:hypothetical protein
VVPSRRLKHHTRRLLASPFQRHGQYSRGQGCDQQLCSPDASVAFPPSQAATNMNRNAPVMVCTRRDLCVIVPAASIASFGCELRIRPATPPCVCVVSLVHRCQVKCRSAAPSGFSSPTHEIHKPLERGPRGITPAGSFNDWLSRPRGRTETPATHCRKDSVV